MKFGLALISYIYRPHRAEYTERSFRSLSRTRLGELIRPALILTYRKSAFNYLETGVTLGSFADVEVIDNEEIRGTDPSFIWTADRLMGTTDATHLVFLTDDFLYHPDWLIQLAGLVERHPGARGWSVYRSAHTRHHRTLEVIDGDHKVTSLSGNGTCHSREEWEAYHKEWLEVGSGFQVPNDFNGGGCTMDLHHAYFHSGDRWATARSYQQHVGMDGTCVHPDIPEYAVDFAGEE